MNRRHFFHSIGAATAAVAMPASAVSFSTEQTAGTSGATSAMFTANPQLTPIRGYRGQDVACDNAWIEGAIPADLRGDFYRNGPGLFERAGQRYHHWFDGDGLVQAWRFTDKGVSHQARFVRTNKFVAESQAGEFLVPAFGTAIKAKMPVRSSDSMNTANTNVIKMDGKLLALWEGGSAHSLTPKTLETQGIVNWSPELKGMPFSAHPKIEDNGTMWNFGTMLGKMVLYHFSPNGKLQKHAIFDSPNVSMVHDFAISQRHLIFLFSPIFLDMQLVQAGNSMVDSMVWKGDQPNKILIVDKDDFSKRRILEIPAFMVFHFGNAWEENGVIRLDLVKSDNLNNFNTVMPKWMRGENAFADPSTPAFLTIDLKKGSVKLDQRSENLEFPRVDPRFVGQRNRYVFYPVATKKIDNNKLNGVMRLDVETGKIDRYDFGDTAIVEEHVVVPKAGSSKEGDAWLVGVGFNIERQQTFASIFDAQNLAAGPVALAHLPYWVPHCFHGNFYSL